MTSKASRSAYENAFSQVDEHSQDYYNQLENFSKK